MNLISIQSHVAYGHVGNSAAVFPLQRIGVEVWPINTVQFSNHTGYGKWAGSVAEPRLIGDLIRGIEQRGVLGECDGVLSGYMGSADIGAAIVEAVATVRRANPAARYCCDPVIGDVDRGVYVAEGVANFIRDTAVPAADIITPNQFELDLLSGRESRSLTQAAAAIDALHALGPRTVLVSSLHTDDTPHDCIDLVASAKGAQVRVRTPKLAVAAHGAGDLLAALFFAHYLRHGKLGEALSRAASAVFGVLAKTSEGGSGEMQIVAAQDEIANPSTIFEAKALGASA